MMEIVFFNALESASYALIKQTLTLLSIFFISLYNSNRVKTPKIPRIKIDLF